MSAITVFESPEFGQILVATIDGKEYFEAVACAKALGYEKPHNAVERHCRYSLKRRVPHPQSPGKTIEKIFIPEGDVYRLVVRSNLPQAERFERWVFDEILPSVRKRGAYLTPDTIEKVFSDPDTIIRIATELKKEQQLRIAAENKIASDKPLVDFATKVGDCVEGIGVREFGHKFYQNGAGFGQNGLVQRLLEGGYVYRDRRGKLRPYAEHTEDGLFWMRTVVIESEKGDFTTEHLKITGKGHSIFLTFICHFRLKPVARSP
jgi:anti-repressor protein